MNDQVLAALRSYIDALHRSVDMNEAFADHVVALARVAEAGSEATGALDPLLHLARHHRIEALKGRSRIAAADQQFAQLAGAERGRSRD